MTDNNGQASAEMPETVSAIPSAAPNKTLRVVFAANVSTNPKAPAYHGYILVDGVLQGAALACAIYRDKENPKAFVTERSVGGTFSCLVAGPTVHTLKDDSDLVQTKSDITGSFKIKALPALVLEAFNKYRATGVVEQFITIQ